MKQITFGLKYLSAGIKMRIEAFAAHFIMAVVFSLKHGAALQCYVLLIALERDEIIVKTGLVALGWFFLEVETLELIFSRIKMKC